MLADLPTGKETPMSTKNVVLASFCSALFLITGYYLSPYTAILLLVIWPSLGSVATMVVAFVLSGAIATIVLLVIVLRSEAYKARQDS